MKNKQEQIEEMAKDLEQAKYWAMGTVGSLNNGFGGWYGAYMYNQGYRKASEVIDEFKNRILNEANLKLVNLDGEHKAIVDLADVLKLADEMCQEV